MTVALVVDDNEENRYLLRQLLAADGFSVVEAPNGRDALDCAEEVPIDLVVSDILMPGMDGFELCREWKSNPRLNAVPFVFYTATYTDPKDQDFALSLGADGFFVKPTDPRVLRDRLREIVQRQRTGTLRRDGGPPLEEAPYLQRYNRVLIRKLEDKLGELEAANRELRIKDFALTSSESGVLLTDDASRISWINPAFGRLLGTPEPNVIGQPLEHWLVLPDDWAAWAAMDSGARHFESSLVGKSNTGPAVSLRVSAHAVMSEAEERLGFMLSCVDVSEERRLRRELERVQRLESLGLFAAGVAHDFNNLLTSMLAGIEIGLAEGVSDAEREEYRGIAIAGFERARELTKRLLAFSRKSNTERRPVNLKHLLEESILLALSGSPIRCERRFPTEEVAVVADPGQLAQVFSNLLVNARQALNDSGTILVAVELAEQQSAAPEGTAPEGTAPEGTAPEGTAPEGTAPEGTAPKLFVTIQITDDGPGIPPHLVTDIFEPYFTTKSEGSGLGLATCHAIVHDHGGRIGVSSELGRGTTFDVWLPWSPGGAVSRRSLAPSNYPTASGRILVMDELVTLRALLQRALERAGYTVVAVGNGEQALLEYQRAKSQGCGFDLLLLDVTVRGAMGGVEAMSELHRMGNEIPVVASTGYTDEETSRGLRAKGFAHVLTKPFMIHELLGTIRAVLTS